MTILEVDSYIEEYLFHTPKWEGIPNAFRARETQNGQPFRPCEPRRYSKNWAACAAMEEEVGKMEFINIYNYMEELEERVGIVGDAEGYSTGELFKLVRATPEQRAGACVAMLQQKKGKE